MSLLSLNDVVDSFSILSFISTNADIKEAYLKLSAPPMVLLRPAFGRMPQQERLVSKTGEAKEMFLLTRPNETKGGPIRTFIVAIGKDIMTNNFSVYINDVYVKNTYQTAIETLTDPSTELNEYKNIFVDMICKTPTLYTYAFY